MQRIAFLLTAAAAAAFLFAPAAARADPIWSYDWSKSTNSVVGDPGNNGSVNLTSFSGTLTGNQSIHATTISAVISPTASQPDHYTSDLYSLVIDLTDQASGKTGELTFTGHLSGTVSPSGPVSLTNVFDSPTTQTIKIGANDYTVTIGPFVSPTGLNATQDGKIDATVQVTPDVPVDRTPEPSGLVLAGVAFAAFGAAWRRGKVTPAV
jgi:hypothetical protein